MKKLKLFFAMVIAVCLSAGSVFADVDVKSIKIAVIWNPYTQNTDAPFGWNVGGTEDQPLQGEWNTTSTTDKYMNWITSSTQAEEISKAQLKFFLSALNPDEITTSGSLDISGVQDMGNVGDWGWGLPNVNVYRSDQGIDYNQIKSDFDNTKPNAIVYIGAGAQIGDDDKDNMFTLLRTAANDNVGIFFIGQRSVTDARDLDPEKTTFPVMGVQRNFTIKTFGEGQYNDLPGKPQGALVNEFSFLKETNSNDEWGNYWEREDTVLVSGYDENYQIHLVKNGQKDRQIYNNGWVNADEIVDPKPKIIHQYGEWSINAKAVEVIEVDGYDSEMNFGFHREKDLLVGKLVSNHLGNSGGTIGDVYIKQESSSMFINGRMVYGPGTNLSQQGLQMDGNLVKDDWTIEVLNPETGRNDKVLVLRKGQYIEDIKHVSADKYYELQGWASIDDWAEYSSGTQVAYNAGGLRDLRISLMNTGSSIFKNVFKHPDLAGKTEIPFKPYGSSTEGNGRIQAAASIWAFNEKLDTSSFSVLLDGGTFDKNKYYVDYLGEQMAGRPITSVATATADGRGQFIRPQAVQAEFDENGDFFRESELPATNSSRNPYFNDFKDKRYNQIAVVQHGTQRLAIVGYQPTFLKEEESRAILHDITNWIGFDQYTLPSPDILWEDDAGNRHSDFDGYVPTNAKSVIIAYDRSLMTEDMRNSEHTLFAELKYGTHEKTLRENIPVGPVSDIPSIERKFDLQNDSETGVKINPDEAGWIKIDIKSWVTPPESGTPFAPSDEVSKTITLKQLAAEACINTNCSPADNTETTSMDELVIKVTNTENGNCEDPDQIIVNINGTETVLTQGTDFSGCEAKLAFAGLPAGELTIKITAVKNYFVNSVEKTIIVNNNPDNIAPFIIKARYQFDQNIDRPTADTLYITFNRDDNVDVKYDESKEIVFWMWSGDGNKYPMKVRLNKKAAAPDDEWIFFVDPAVYQETGYREPTQGDSVNINNEVNMTDKYGNEVKERNDVEKTNQPVLMTISTKPKNVNVYVLPGKDKNDFVSKMIKPSTDNPIIDEVVNNPDNGSIIVIDPGIRHFNKDEAERISCIILDPLGNKVVEYTYKNTYENGNIENMASTVVAMEGGVKNFFTVMWNNKNSAGRDVGSGSYLVIVESVWKGNNHVFKHQKPIPVTSKIKN